MGVDYTPSHPEKEQVELSFVGEDSDLAIKKFTSYSVGSHFLSPSDGWDVTVASDHLDDNTKNALVCGAKIKLTINGGVQCTGFIESIQTQASRGSGTEYRIQGKDVLGPVCNACADPKQQFKSQSLEDILVTLFTPFGFSKPDQFIISNDANRDLQALVSERGQRLSRGGKKKGPKPLKSYTQHQCKPYPKESVFNFAARLAKRAGLWIWATASGKQIVVGTPAFDVDPFYELRRNAHGGTNVLDGSVTFDLTDQPTMIIADAFTNGGEFGRGRAQAYAFNPAVTTRGGFDTTVLDNYKSAREVVLPKQQQNTVMIAPYPNIQYLSDDESQTQEQLENFIKRTMAELQHRSLQVSFTVEGHGQNSSEDGFHPWTVDTTVRVTDEISGLDETLYIIGRVFSKSRSGGTTTHLDLVRLNSLAF